MRPRYVFIGILFLLEMVWLSLRIDTPAKGAWWLLLFANAGVTANIGIAFLAVAGWLLFQRAAELTGDFASPHRWWGWLVAHTVTFAFFLALGPNALEATPPSAPDVIGWLLLGVLSFVLLAFCILKPAALLALLRNQYRLVLLSIAAAVGAWLLGRVFQQLWEPLAAATFSLTYSLLQPTGLDIRYDPDQGVIGTERFLVQIAPQCSGYEGIALAITFVTLYIFVFRRTLRFPAVLLLYPIGTAIVYVVNSIRISALVLIGHYSSAEDAVRAFHSQAGWTLFTLVSISLLFISRAVPAFNRLQGEPAGRKAASRSAHALLLPFLVFLGSGLAISTIAGGSRWAAIGSLVPTLATLWYYRETYRNMVWKWTWRSVLIGVAVFVVWALLVDGDPNAEGTDAALWRDGSLPLFWIVPRAVVSTLIVPIVEELAFRGYLLRKLASADFETIPVGAFTITSLAASSLLFGLLHEHWTAGTIAGLAYALAQWQGRSIGSAIVAHGVTNGLIAAVAVLDQNWKL